MAKPISLSVDDDSDVLRAIERDLRSQYGAEYRVIGSDSPEGALDLLKQLKVRNDSVALLLADQRMPRMDGVEFLQEAMGIFPGAKRALLTAYADTNAAISAINHASINYFFLKPWDPPAEHLYPQLDDLLDDWQASFRPTFQGIRVLGTRWSPRSYELRDFLARNHVPYQWIDVELSANDPETKRLLEALGPEATNLPVVLFPDGTKLLESVPADVAQKVGLRTRAQTSFYDLAIVGGGPAGLAAAVYGASEGLHTVMIEREAPGGQAGMSSRIENYLGFPTGLSGGDLARRAVVQAQRFGVEILAPQEAVGVRTEGSYRIIKLADGNEISCHALMIATGVQWRRLEAPGIARLQGAGIYYGGGVILVYDISRWGRFQDTDEAAHYEFLCKNSGIPVHYCAEPFANDATLPSSILKTLKRTMAGEYSRELGVKVFDGKSRLVRLGFRVGGQAGYGLRRMMLSAGGKPKQQLHAGEYKGLTTDRITLVPGPKKELQCVRDIYEMVLHKRKTCSEIARDLNRRCVPYVGGRSWSYSSVYGVLTNPKYTGCNTWNRTSQRLHGPHIYLASQHWISKPGAFTSIIDQGTFDRVQTIL